MEPRIVIPLCGIFSKMKPKLTSDFETRSACDLKKSGAYKYSLDPSTQPTCFSFKTPGTPVRLLRFHEINKHWSDHDASFKRAWTHHIATKLFSAHNAFFEICIYKNILVRRYGWPDIPFRLWRCTAAKAAACALPRNLEGAGSALELKTQKDKWGHAAVMATCKPTRQWVAWKKKIGFGASKLFEPPMFLEPNAAPDVWKRLYHYNEIDTLAEEELDNTLPDLSSFEQEIWFLNIQLNWRGIKIDIPTVKKIVDLMETEKGSRLREMDILTMGAVTKPGARQSIMDFLEAEGTRISDIKKKTIEDALKNPTVSGSAKRLLELRQLLSKTSTRKYQAFINRSNLDNRVRDILMYHGASTGRDTGTGCQFQNLPRPLIKQKDIDYVLDILQEHNTEGVMDWIKFLYGDPARVFSSLIRSMLIPSKGKELFVADFSKIEVAVLWWLADNKPGLRVLQSGKDPYKYQAAANTGETYDDIADDGDDRQLGKCQVLGCGFGMGWERFLETAALPPYNLTLTEEQARFAVNSYREANAAVPVLWKNYEKAMVTAIEEHKNVTINKCSFYVRDNFLWIRLPSGRRLAYRNPSIGMRENDWGPQKTVEYWAVNPKTKKWNKEITWGGKIVENVVQATARDLMMNPLPKLESLGYQILLTVHDEVISEKEINKGSVKEFCSILCARPIWTDEELPLEAKGWKGMRYRK